LDKPESEREKTVILAWRLSDLNKPLVAAQAMTANSGLAFIDRVRRVWG
jgi:hypothetical protein